MKTVAEAFKRKEKVEEDLYFAKRDRELLKASNSQQVRPWAGEPIVIVSGGQTGVDRAALEAAMALGLPVGGWCPKGRRAEDGAIDARYPLRETPSLDYAQRTAWNVRDADATLILYREALSGGTLLTAQLARRAGRPLLTRDLSAGFDEVSAARWLTTNHIDVLNCAGPRESGVPGIQAEALACLGRLFSAWRECLAVVD
ncbi:hypothetical protein G3480_07885 [Thiorhodococcus mannitoliphagus]|uniref:Molybdenum cofactor carrier n=1 Tax=Thiorhodococcus mannitoliphagus TaxID=329406 RepID=A0A6P1DSQ8_9GAMM|nr:putative molybdenum carrier protein [Thiorhodococcus mannitoliphagus]NEX20233.1 hypothetical protein [Thiorhodococcus mannitoliphagus]